MRVVWACVWKRSGRYRKSFQMWRDALTINACIRGRRQGPAVDSPSGVSLILPSSDISVPLEKNTICRVLKALCTVVSFFFTCLNNVLQYVFFASLPLFFRKDSNTTERTSAKRLTWWRRQDRWLEYSTTSSCKSSLRRDVTTFRFIKIVIVIWSIKYLMSSLIRMISPNTNIEMPRTFNRSYLFYLFENGNGRNFAVFSDF